MLSMPSLRSHTVASGARYCHMRNTTNIRPLIAAACRSWGLIQLQHHRDRGVRSFMGCYSRNNRLNHHPAITAPVPGCLLSHFENRPFELHSSGWSELWDTDQADLWDRGKPSPALIDWIESNSRILPRPTDGRRLKALIPGCGKGYDVAALALHGYDAYGLEVSDTGAAIAREYIKCELVHPQKYNYGDAQWRTSQVGNAHIVEGDFFAKEWQTPDLSNFDLIYDYTFLCALPPELRRPWARRMHKLLAPSGVLVCLEFPRYKGLNLPGPPWGVEGVYWNLLAEGGDGLIKEPVKEEGDPEGPFKRVEFLSPPRTYESGEGTDMLSIWRAKPWEISG